MPSCSLSNQSVRFTDSVCSFVGNWYGPFVTLQFVVGERSINGDRRDGNGCLTHRSWQYQGKHIRTRIGISARPEFSACARRLMRTGRACCSFVLCFVPPPTIDCSFNTGDRAAKQVVKALQDGTFVIPGTGRASTTSAGKASRNKERRRDSTKKKARVRGGVPWIVFNYISQYC